MKQRPFFVYFNIKISLTWNMFLRLQLRFYYCKLVITVKANSFIYFKYFLISVLSAGSDKQIYLGEFEG